MEKNISQGDYIRIKTSTEEIKGILMPSTPSTLFIKLDNGYNLGIKKNKIKSVSLIKKHSAKIKKPKSIKQKSSLPIIAILHTGGTITSKVDYSTGGVVTGFTPEELIASVPEISKIANISSKLVANLQSESMRFGHYNLMVKAIKEEIKKKPKGIIITHGTDTLHYSSSALSFMIDNPPCPIILVGAQRSSDRGSSDSAMNLICATKFIVKTDFKGVAICMHKNLDDLSCLILPGLKTRKLHTSRRDAFKPINTTPIAEVFYNNDKIIYYQRYKKTQGKFKTTKIKENIKIGILKSHTNILPENISCFKGYEGLILEGTGLGHFQTKGFDKISSINEKNKKELAKLAKNTLIVMTSQAIFGRVNMNIYTPQRELLDIGIIPGEDMTTETAFIKLAWLLSNYKKDKVKELVRLNLKGEINERLHTDFL